MKVLVLGAGQLAQMMYLAAAPLGVEVLAVDVSKNTVVHPLSKQLTDIDLTTAINDANAITVEFEHIPEDLLAQVDLSGKLFPNIASIMAGADRVREKQLLNQHNIANCEHKIIRHVDDLEGICELLGEQIIFKASRDGYDGYGQWRLKDSNQLALLKMEFEKLDLQAVPLIAEKMSHFDREISIVGARDLQGNISCFEIAENLHYQGQLHVSIAPAPNVSTVLTTGCTNFSLAHEAPSSNVSPIALIASGVSQLLSPKSMLRPNSLTPPSLTHSTAPDLRLSSKLSPCSCLSITLRIPAVCASVVPKASLI